MGLMEMLPEYETPVPRTAGFHAEQKKHFGLRERVCVTCEKRFILSAGQIGYKRNVQGKELAFCSWSCLRKDEKERVLVKAGRKKGACKSIEQKRADMERKNAEDRALLNGPHAKHLTKKERDRIAKRIGERTRRFERSTEGI